jgi:5-methylcytosine-specific restriction endonuclease McrA
MSRCKSITNLEVHHKRRDSGNELANAEVLCQWCHGNTSSYGRDGLTPPPFSQKTKDEALKRAGYQCECERIICGTH